MNNKNNNKFLLLFFAFVFLLFGQVVHSQTTQIPDYSDTYPREGLETRIPNANSSSLSPCPTPEREPRFVYRERVVHEERQFRAKHTGCGGDIMMRKWQVVGLEIGRCDGGPNEDCNDPSWMDEFVYFYDRYTPNQEGEIFEEVGSWQKAWPSSGEWLTEEELEEKYGEPIPFPTCQTACLQAPPGVPGRAGDFNQEDPYYFKNPWLPEIAGGENPQNIEELREKNVLGGENPLERVRLPIKLFWWNIPGWHEGWIENGKFKTCEDSPDNVSCVDSYIIRFDNINREDRPPTFHRHEVVTRLLNEGGGVISYNEAQKKFEELIELNQEVYEYYRRETGDTRSVDVLRYDRDNIIGCDNCGTEKEIWLDTNTFNPLDYNPKHEYDRYHREIMKNWLLDKYDSNDQVEGIITDIIEDTYNHYGRPAFFRSDVEHNYTLQAACSPHDYLEEGEGNKGPEATFSFETSDAPELISPIDPNWTSPYEPKEYDPNFSSTRIKTDKYEGQEEGYQYPADEIDGDFLREAGSLKNSSHDILWDNDPNELILQDQVSFREQLKWAQQWYQPHPERRPLPPRIYLLNYGEGIRVIEDNDSDYGEPVLEDCHEELSGTIQGNPICTYQQRPTRPHETRHRFPEPNHLDREMEFFTLPENRERDIYSWNVASCRDSATTDCTNFSQRWRFQLDRDEEDNLFPPKNIQPLDIGDDHGTVGFPFEVSWERRFGARSYVYRLREKGGDWKDVKVSEGNSVYYDLGDLSTTVSFSWLDLKDLKFEGIFDLNTEYEWDVKACWDSNINHDIDEDGNPEDYTKKVLDWVESNKECSNWRSEDYDDAPFTFKTTGRKPSYATPPFLFSNQVDYPIEFDWESVPGAKSYAVEIHVDSGGFDDFEFSNIYLLTPESEFTYFREVLLNQDYGYNIYTCARPLQNNRVEYIFSKEEFEKRRKQQDCYSEPRNETFMPILSSPSNLSPGNENAEEAITISPDENIQTLSWGSVWGAEAYLVKIDTANTITNKNTVYAAEKTFPDMAVTQETSLNYEFPVDHEATTYEWTVQSCLTEDCQPPAGENPSTVRSLESSPKYIQVSSPYSFLDFKGVVPCGRNINIFDAEANIDSRDDCEFMHLFVMIGLIIEEILVKIIIPYSLILLLIYTGYLYYVGLGDPKTMQKVFKVWEYALKGYLLILLSWFIVGAFLSLIGYQFGTWWQITNL